MAVEEFEALGNIFWIRAASDPVNLVLLTMGCESTYMKRVAGALNREMGGCHTVSSSA